MTEPDTASPPWSAPASLPNLAAGEIHVFALPLDVPAARLPEFEELLSRDEADRAVGFLRAGDRSRYVVGRVMLRTILGRYLERDTHELAFVYGSHGKPALKDRGGQERLHFNLSRSQQLAVVALQLDCDIGIDLERVRRFPHALDIAKRFLAPQEHDALCSLPTAGLDAVFFSYWTRKEAVVKSIGLGLSQPVDGFVLGLHPGVEGERAIVRDTPCWVVQLPPPSRVHVAALATLGLPRPLHCWTWRDPLTLLE